MLTCVCKYVCAQASHVNCIHKINYIFSVTDTNIHVFLYMQQYAHVRALCMYTHAYVRMLVQKCLN